MKKRVLQILKYIGIGFVGLIFISFFISLISPEPNTAPVQITDNNQSVKNVSDEKTNDSELEVATNTKAIDINLESKEESVQPVEQIQSEPETQQKPQEQYYAVTNVVDGDTIKININGTTETIRLIGMDTPETVDPRKPVQCFGVEASNKAKELLSGRQVRIETDSSQGTRDIYGRLLAYVHRSDGLFFNRHMIEEGYAYEYTYNTPYKYQAEFKKAQQLAESSQKGLWSPNTCNGDASTGVEGEGDTQQSQSSSNSYYTSSYPSSKYYYPGDCSAWQGLSDKYLKSFNTLDELLSSYSRTLSPQCD